MLASTAHTSDRTLLARCSRGDAAAVDALVDRYVTSGLAMASRLAGEDAAPDRVLDGVHDAFITAFDDALDGDADSPGPVFSRLLGAFASAIRATPTAANAKSAAAITPDEARQLRLDIISEVRLTMALRVESPHSWISARRIVQELRRVRRRFRQTLKLGSLYDDLKILAPSHQPHT
ncbi:MAG: hypothetical protein JWM41_314 [Gemmatimonadetes bacterium]|nr:hypothetical protein [Gemmatimonadota bacterium]